MTCMRRKPLGEKRKFYQDQLDSIERTIISVFTNGIKKTYIEYIDATHKST